MSKKTAKKTITTNKRQRKKAVKKTSTAAKPKVETSAVRKEEDGGVYLTKDDLFRIERVSLKEEKERALMSSADQQMTNITLSQQLLVRDAEIAKKSQAIHGRNLNQLRTQKTNLIKEIAEKYKMGGTEFGYDPDSGKLVTAEQLK